MLAKVNSAALYGIDALRVEVEIDLASGLPQLATVGLAEGAVKESKDRIRAAVKNCGYTFPAKRITINLAPADIKKKAQPTICRWPSAFSPPKGSSRRNCSIIIC
jgi:magnesium chelatase family protein